MREMKVYKVNENEPVLVSGFSLESNESHYVKGRGEVHVCKWPDDIEPFSLTGKVIVFNGSLYEVTSVEVFGKIECGKKFGMIVKPFKRNIDESL